MDGGSTDGGSKSWSGGPRREEKEGKKGFSEKENVADGQEGELCGADPYLSGVKIGKVALFIKASHPSAPYSSAPTDWK